MNDSVDKDSASGGVEKAYVHGDTDTITVMTPSRLYDHAPGAPAPQLTSGI